MEASPVNVSYKVEAGIRANKASGVGSCALPTLTIPDNDSAPPPLPTVTVSASDANASESGDTGAFTLTRTGSTASALTVNYSLSGSASNGSDYQQLGHSVTIAADRGTPSVTVAPTHAPPR